jgi:hypothetical protein
LAMGISVCTMVAITATSTMVQSIEPWPILQVYRWFITGEFGHYDSPVRVFGDLSHAQWRQTKFNLGQRVGLEGQCSLLLYYGLFVIYLRCCHCALRNRERI